MKRNLYILLVVVFALVTLVVYLLFQSKPQDNVNVSPSPAAATNQVIFPAGGESLLKGNSYTLRWNGGQNPIQIFLIDISSETQGASVSIADRVYGVKNNGSYQYTVPDSVENGTYKFQIGSLESNPFEITNSSNESEQAHCQPEELEGLILSEGAAGTFYGRLSIKNTSANICRIVGDNFIEAQYNASNILVTNQGQTGQKNFTLSPDQTVYSAVSYPNGPQCEGETVQTNISFDYQVSPNKVVTFKDPEGKTEQNITICEQSEEDTEVKVWSISGVPIN